MSVPQDLSSLSPEFLVEERRHLPIRLVIACVPSAQQGCYLAGGILHATSSSESPQITETSVPASF
jgi:hypothetical protein